MLIKAIIFDFDGVILDSVDVKTKAFEEMYSIYGKKIQRKVVDYHLMNGGISRYEKFRYWHQKFLGKVLTDLEVQDLANEFSDIVFEKVCSSKYISGAYEFLNYCDKKYLTFVCTGTPDNEIKKILFNKQISKFFNSAHGSPKGKVDIIKEIINSNDLSPNEILFIGDAMTDYNASMDTNLNFIGIRNKDTVFPNDTILVNDLMEIIDILNL